MAISLRYTRCFTPEVRKILNFKAVEHKYMYPTCIESRCQIFIEKLINFNLPSFEYIIFHLTTVHKKCWHRWIICRYKFYIQSETKFLRSVNPRPFWKSSHIFRLIFLSLNMMRKYLQAILFLESTRNNWR